MKPCRATDPISSMFFFSFPPSEQELSGSWAAVTVWAQKQSHGSMVTWWVHSHGATNHVCFHLLRRRAALWDGTHLKHGHQRAVVENIKRIHSLLSSTFTVYFRENIVGFTPLTLSDCLVFLISTKHGILLASQLYFLSSTLHLQ